MQEVKAFYVNRYFLTFILSLKELIVPVVEVLEIIKPHVLLIASSAFMNVVYEMGY